MRRSFLLLTFIIVILASVYNITSAYADEEQGLDIVEYIEESIDETIIPSVEEPEPNIFQKLYSMVFNNNNSEYSIKETAHYLFLKYTLAEKEYLTDKDTIDTVIKEKPETWIGQFDAIQQIYDPGEESDYYVSFANDIGLTSSKTSILDATFTKTNNYGEIVDGPLCDFDTGIIYLPKNLYFDENSEEIPVVGIQCQMLMSYSFAENATSEMVVEIQNDRKDVEIQNNASIEVNPLDITVDVPIVSPETANNISLDNITVYFDDQPASASELISNSNAIYNTDTGILTLATAPVSTAKVTVMIADETIIDKVVTSSAKAYASNEYADRLKTIPFWSFINLDTSKIKVGDTFQYEDQFRHDPYRNIWTHDIFTQEQTAPYGYGWIDNSNPATFGENTTYALSAWIINNGTSDSIKAQKWSAADILRIASPLPTQGGPWGWDTSFTLTIPGYEDGSRSVRFLKSTSSGETLDFEYRTNYKPTTTIGDDTFSIHDRIVLECGHSTESIGNKKATDKDGNPTVKIGTTYLRVLAVEDDYIVLAFLGSIHESQAGVGIYKFAVEPAKGDAEVVKVDGGLGGVPEGDADLAGAQFTLTGPETKTITIIIRILLFLIVRN